MAAEFKRGDPVAVVFVDTGKLIADMGANDCYFVNDAKIAKHKDFFRKGFFEAPIVLPRGSRLMWLEGFHQMTVAVTADLPVVPVITTRLFVAETKRLVGAENAELYKGFFDLSGCEDLWIYY